MKVRPPEWFARIGSTVANPGADEIGPLASWRPDELPATFQGRKVPALYVICAMPAVCIVLAAAFSRTDVNLAIALPLALLFFGLAWAVNTMLGRMRLTYTGWRVRWQPGLGRVQSFDCRQVSEIRQRRNRGGMYYVLCFRSGEARDPDDERSSHSRTLRLPMSGFRDRAVFDHLLARVAAVPGVDADRGTAALLDSWRRRGVGPDSATQDG